LLGVTAVLRPCQANLFALKVSLEDASYAPKMVRETHPTISWIRVFPWKMNRGSISRWG